MLYERCRDCVRREGKSALLRTLGSFASRAIAEADARPTKATTAMACAFYRPDQDREHPFPGSLIPQQRQNWAIYKGQSGLWRLSQECGDVNHMPSQDFTGGILVVQCDQLPLNPDEEGSLVHAVVPKPALGLESRCCRCSCRYE